MQLVKDNKGRTLLHIWRTGTSFDLTSRFQLYKDWNNIKFSTLPYADEPPYIHHFELRKSLPFSDNQFDVIYCNHVLEHLIPEDGQNLCKELLRLLKPNGICRIVVPDLESAAVEYLKTLENVQQENSSNNMVQYEWAAAHLIDQMVRLKPGGKMAEKLRLNQVDWEQITRHNGDVFDKIKANNQRLQNRIDPIQNRFKIFYKENGLLNSIKKLFYHLRRKIYIKLSHKTLVELLNEKNLWMYDRQSLSKLLQDSNFKDVKLVSYKTSQIKGWKQYNFDQSEKGDYPLEPSVYMEGIKK